MESPKKRCATPQQMRRRITKVLKGPDTPHDNSMSSAHIRASVPAGHANHPRRSR